MSRAPNVSDLPFLVPVPDVALVLGYSDDTIHRHLVPIEEWERLTAEEREGKIPGVKIGGHSRVPRLWLEGLMEKIRRVQVPAQLADG